MVITYIVQCDICKRKIDAKKEEFRIVDGEDVCNGCMEE